MRHGPPVHLHFLNRLPGFARACLSTARITRPSTACRATAPCTLHTSASCSSLGGHCLGAYTCSSCGAKSKTRPRLPSVPSIPNGPLQAIWTSEPLKREQNLEGNVSQRAFSHHFCHGNSTARLRSVPHSSSEPCTPPARSSCLGSPSENHSKQNKRHLRPDLQDDLHVYITVTIRIRRNI